MNARIAAILVVLLVVLGGGALLYYQQERGRRPANVETLGRTLLPDLRIADVAEVKIIEPKATLTLDRQAERWVIEERGGFPADLGKVREFVLKLASLKVGQSEPIGEKDRARLNLDASGTRVELASADGKTLAALTLGKKYYKREVENPGKAPADGRFVASPGEDKQVFLVSDPLAQASAASADWIDRTAFKVEKVKSLEVRYPDGSGYRISRSGDNTDWQLEGAGPGEKVDVFRANAASYSLSLLELADVAPKEVRDTGLANPILINATTLAGRTYNMKIGKLEGDNYYLSFKSAGAEEKPLEILQSQYILLVPKSKLEDTLKKRAELLEKKQDTKK
ncbi:MAG TPA: DUF4340 domain-containing protein [Burkholderiales bacterium]|nr:DUF4340 domain-containing protein [Burkholderiales bacterium]